MKTFLCAILACLLLSVGCRNFEKKAETDDWSHLPYRCKTVGTPSGPLFCCINVKVPEAKRKTECWHKITNTDWTPPPPRKRVI